MVETRETLAVAIRGISANLAVEKDNKFLAGEGKYWRARENLFLQALGILENKGVIDFKSYISPDFKHIVPASYKLTRAVPIEVDGKQLPIWLEQTQYISQGNQTFMVVGDGFAVMTRIEERTATVLNLSRVSTPTDWRGQYLNLETLKKSAGLLTFIDHSLPEIR